MAAPTIPSSKKHANLNKLISKENTPKVTRKNILCPAPEEWPRLSAAVEDEILKKLTESLKDQVNIVKSTKKTSDKDRSEKSKIRSQLEIGVSSVFRALERGTLACVLVSGQATPAVAVDHVISLSRERGCPVLCLDQLAPTIARATQSKWHPLALGFKKVEVGAHSDFAEVMSIIVENATVTPPKIGPYSSSNDLLRGRKPVPKVGTSKYKPLRINVGLEAEILGDLKRIFSQMLASDTNKNKDFKKKKKKKKGNLKGVFDKVYHSLFEIGKRTVTGTLERGKLQLVLVAEEILPVLLSEDLSCSLLSVAASKKCPVVVMPGLAGAMRTLCRGSVSVLGFKKEASTESNPNDFKPVIEKCLQAITDPYGSLITQEHVPVDIQSTCDVQVCATEGQSVARADHECDSLRHFAGTGTNKGFTDTVAEIRANKGSTGIYARTGPNKDNAETVASTTWANKDNTETVPKTKTNKDNTETSMDNIHNETSESEEEEDYSYLYVLKKDSKELAEVKRELNAAAESAIAKDAFTADFISFSQGLDQGKAGSQNSARKLKAGTAGLRNSGSLHSKKAKSIVSRSVDSKQKIERSGDFKDSPDSSSASGHIDNGRLSASGASVSPLFTLSRSGDLVDVSPVLTMSGSGDSSNVSLAITMSRSGDSQSTLTSSQSTNSPKVSPAFTISRSGDLHGHTNTTKLTAQREAKNSSQGHHDEFALGMQELSQSKDGRTTGIDYIALGESSKKEKKTLKRKLQGDSSFISFAYTEANIKTMVSDPSKKRKKKKKH